MYAREQSPPPNCRSSVSSSGEGVPGSIWDPQDVVASAVKDRWDVQGRKGRRQEESLAPPPPLPPPFHTASHRAIPTYRREVCRGRVTNSLALHGWNHLGQFSPASRSPFNMF